MVAYLPDGKRTHGGAVGLKHLSAARDILGGAAAEA